MDYQNSTSPRSLKSTISAVGFVQLSSLIVGLLNAIILSRWLGASGRGIYIFLNLIVQIVGTIVDFGIPNAISTFLLRREFAFQSIFSTGFLFALARAILSGFIVTSLWFFWPKFHDIGLVAFILVLFACVLNILYTLGKTVLFCSGDLKSWAFFEILNFILNIFIISISWLLSISKDPIYVFSINVSVQLIILVISCFIIYKHVEIKVTFTYRDLIKNILKFSSKNFLNNLIWLLGARVDLYIVGALLSPSSLGVYSISTGLSDKIQTVLMILPQGLYPIQSSGQNENQNVEKITAKAIRVSLTLGFLITFCLMLIVPFLLPLIFGEEYSGAVSPFMVLALNTVLFTTFHFLGGYMTGRKLKPEVSAFFGLLMIIVNFSGNLLLIPKLDILGAAIANLISTIVILIPFGLYFSKSANLPIKSVFLIERDDIIDLWNMFFRIFIRGILLKLFKIQQNN